MADPWSQDKYRCRLEWGRRGARAAAERGDVLVVIDVLRFSTATVTAVQHGGIIYPCAWADDPVAYAARIGGEAAVRRRDVPESGRFSLSPRTFEAIEPGTRVVLASPNGATCSQYGREVPHLLVGALVNAWAVAEAVAAILAGSDEQIGEEGGRPLSMTVLACGERWKEPNEDGELRFAIEDYLGAGAILSALPSSLSRSPEATICQGAFLTARDDLKHILWESGSGRELRVMGSSEDVEHASRLDVYDAVPVMRGDMLTARERDAAL